MRLIITLITNINYTIYMFILITMKGIIGKN